MYSSQLYFWQPEYCIKKVPQMIQKALAGETRDKIFYEYLINIAPDEQDKNIIKSIRDDEMRHFKLFRMIYQEITGCDPMPLDSEEFVKPENYLAGIEEAIIDEVTAAKNYRQIYVCLRGRKYRDILFSIITDELRHASLYNYLYTKNIRQT